MAGMTLSDDFFKVMNERGLVSIVTRLTADSE